MEKLLLDGAMGTMLQQRGLQPGESPMLWNLTQPSLVEDVHRQYIASGSGIILTNTFGANRRNLDGSGVTPQEIIQAAVKIAKQAAEGTAVKIALDIGPLGELLAPLGALTFDEAYALFREQIEAGVEAGADLVFIETMTDLQEVRAALLAAKECDDLPVFVTMSFEPAGQTFFGTLCESFAIVATGLGASAIGLNCSTAPKQMAVVVERILQHTNLPVIVKPNAGLPDPATGAYAMTPDEFAQSMVSLTELGATILGGCCGTDPAYIKALAKGAAFRTPAPAKLERPAQSIVCSASKLLPIDGIRIIGERINPSGKPDFRKALTEGNWDYVQKQAILQELAGADLLDVNVGVPELNEAETMANAILSIQAVSELPLQIDSANPDALEAGLRYYKGKAIVNSVNGEAAVLNRVLPLVKQYGAAVIGLTLDKNGIPATAAERLAIARRILDAATAHGIPKEDVYIDCLALTVFAQPTGAAETLLAVRAVREELGLQTVLGISNISFGLPNRALINQTFLAMAFQAGLTMPILDPTASGMTDTVAAFRLLAQSDPEGKQFIAKFADKSAAGETFDAVKQSIAKRGQSVPDKGTVVLATVQGDIHDIGRNIVKVALEHEGYRVLDLGRDVSPEAVVETAIRKKAPLIGLSALMTTTLPAMADTIGALRQSGHACKIMVGGAVLTPEYAKEIGADYFAKDASESIAIAREVFCE